VNITRQIRRSAVSLAIAGALLVLIGSAQAASTKPGLSKAEYRALLLRSQALNHEYGLGSSAKPAGMSAAEYRVLKVRSEALNRQYGLGGSAERQPQAATVVADARFGWGEFGLGAAAMLGLVLLTSGLVVGGRYGRRIPRASTS